MEIYTQDKNRTVELVVPVQPIVGTVIIELCIEGEVVDEIAQVKFQDDTLSFDMPFYLTTHEKKIDVLWQFNYEENGRIYEYCNTELVEVVEPVLSRKEILEVHPNATDKEVEKIEKAVRHIIQAFTGQTFGRFEGTYTTSGENSSYLRLPRRALSVESINGVDVDGSLQLVQDGFGLRVDSYGVSTVKADDRGYHMHTGGIIHNPNNIKLTQFSSVKQYRIRGIWGWREVPSPIKEAAKLLVNDYACGDAQYRDRYLTSMTAADWRIQFNDGAFSQTGNVRADQLLREFVLKRGWAVI